MAKQVQISVSLDPDIVAAVDQLAANEHRSRSNQVELLLREALAARRESVPE